MEAKLALVKTYVVDSHRAGIDIIHNYLSTQLNVKRILRQEIVAYKTDRVQYAARVTMSQPDGYELAEADLERLAGAWASWLQTAKKIPVHTKETIVGLLNFTNNIGIVLVEDRLD